MERVVYYHGIPIEYNLTYKKVKNINVRINEEGEILVSARKNLSLEMVENFMLSKAEWIIRTLAEVERYKEMKPDESIYTGKVVFLLGKAYSVSIIESKDKNIVVEGDNIIINTPFKDEDIIKEQYLKWLKAIANHVFNEGIKKVYDRVEEEIPYPSFTIRNMKSRWGSCIPSKNKITLNLQLIKTDEDCIEQVILHELMHFLEPNHSEKFYKLVNKYCPNEKRIKERLGKKYKDGI